MDFEDKYTTAQKIDKDTEGKESQKEVLSSDAFAVGELLEILAVKLERLTQK